MKTKLDIFIQPPALPAAEQFHHRSFCDRIVIYNNPGIFIGIALEHPDE